MGEHRVTSGAGHSGAYLALDDLELGARDGRGAAAIAGGSD